jgi:tyrosyl-tRNA synthetase
LTFRRKMAPSTSPSCQLSKIRLPCRYVTFNCKASDANNDRAVQRLLTNILERQHGEQALHQAQQNLRKFQAHLEDVHADLTEFETLEIARQLRVEELEKENKELPESAQKDSW